MRPVDERFPISQLFAGLATRGVVGRPNGSEVEYLVWLYGDYQPYGHAGVDIACPVGTPIRAMRAGTVVYAGWGEDLPGDESWGPSGYFRRWGMYKTFPGIVTVIKVDGVNEFDIYGHQADNEAVHVGMHVGEGQFIGLSGDTKTRTTKVGPHLHVVTVADPVNYSTDWPRIIFGCVDPTPYFGNTGLVLQGAITNAATTQAQEDDMPFTPAEVKQLVTEGVQDYFRLKGEMQDGRNVIDHLNQTRTDVVSAKEIAVNIPQQVLFDTRVDGRNVFDTLKQIRTDLFGTRSDGAVDVDALAASLAERLEARDLASLAEKLQITVKESPNG
jgi:hypothetical protein